MAIAVDQATIGSAAIDSALGTVAFTTTVAVPAGDFITIDIGAAYTSGSPTVTGIADDAVSHLTWTIDKQASAAVVGPNVGLVAKASAQAPAGLPSGTTITATFSASAAGGRSIAGSSFTGVATSSPVDGTPPAVASFTATTAWATNAATIAAGSLLSGMAWQATSNFTSVPTSPSIEEYDINGGAGSFSATGAYRIEVSGGSFTVAGTWSGSSSGLALAVAYLAAAGGASSASTPRNFNAIPFMGGVI